MAESAAGPSAHAAPCTAAGASGTWVMFQRFFARRSAASSRVEPGASTSSALAPAAWKPNMPPRLLAMGAMRLRHASMPFSTSEAPVGGGPTLDSRGSSPSTESPPSPATGSSYSSAASGLPRCICDLSSFSAADLAAASSGDGAVTMNRAPGSPARTNEIMASRAIRLRCLRFISSATTRYSPQANSTRVKTCTSSFMASICSCCGQEVSPGCRNASDWRKTYPTTSSMTLGAGGHVWGLRLWICACAWQVRNVLCRLLDTGLITPLGWLSCAVKFSKCAKMGTGLLGSSLIW
mmetsp:Transcript_24273/g.60298  ORF Transcript_24273/g.60298 Transcript_24273/m.60298 type:complete len:294 (-) Transcript_24273:1041-1922(-)